MSAIHVFGDIPSDMKKLTGVTNSEPFPPNSGLHKATTELVHYVVY